MVLVWDYYSFVFVSFLQVQQFRIVCVICVSDYVFKYGLNNVHLQQVMMTSRGFEGGGV